MGRMFSTWFREIADQICDHRTDMRMAGIRPPGTTLVPVVENAQDAYITARQIAADRRVAGLQR